MGISFLLANHAWQMRIPYWEDSQGSNLSNAPNYNGQLGTALQVDPTHFQYSLKNFLIQSYLD